TARLLGSNLKPLDFMVVDLSKDLSIHQRYKIEWCINLIMIMNFVSKCSDMAKELGTGIDIDLDIFGNAITAVFTKSPFNREQLETYFYAKAEVYDVMDKMADLHDSDGYLMPPDLDLFLLGVDLDRAVSIRLDDPIHQKYNTYYCKYENGDMQAGTFIEKC